jgi:hypothetical protein
MTYWDQYNPWRERAVYVPIEELAEALADGSNVKLSDGTVAEYTAEFILEHCQQYSLNLDAYILPSDVLGYSVGVRYGSHGPEYLSLYARDKSKIEELYARYVDVPSIRQ